MSVESEGGSDLATCFVNVDDAPVAEGVAAAVVGGGFGLLDMGPAPVDLEALFLGLTSRAPEGRA